MANLELYHKLLKERGKPLSEINPGSNEIALETRDALIAIEELKNNQIPILGGDTLTISKGKISYAHVVFGNDAYFSWYCEKIKGESLNDYAERSCEISVQAIMKAKEIAEKLNHPSYVVLVI